MPRLRIDSEEVTLNYRDEGSGREAVVLLHGFPFTSDLWDAQIAALSDRYRTITPDLRGFGLSDLSPRGYSIARLADDVEELLLALDIDRAVVVGLSMGGYVAFEFYRRHPNRVSALVLADTRPDSDTDEVRANRVATAERVRREGSRSLVDELVPKLLAPRTRTHQPQVESALRRMMESTHPDAIVAALSAMADRDDSRPLLANISVPVLAIAGAEDGLTPPDEMREWARSIPGAKIACIERAGHVSNLENPSVFNALVGDFLANMESAS